MNMKVTKEMAEAAKKWAGLPEHCEVVGYDDAAKAQVWICSITEPPDEYGVARCAECDRTIFFDPSVKTEAKKMCLSCVTQGRFDL